MKTSVDSSFTGGYSGSGAKMSGGRQSCTKSGYSLDASAAVASSKVSSCNTAQIKRRRRRKQANQRRFGFVNIAQFSFISLILKSQNIIAGTLTSTFSLSLAFPVTHTHGLPLLLLLLFPSPLTPSLSCPYYFSHPYPCPLALISPFALSPLHYPYPNLLLTLSISLTSTPCLYPHPFL